MFLGDAREQLIKEAFVKLEFEVLMFTRELTDAETQLLQKEL